MRAYMCVTAISVGVAVAIAGGSPWANIPNTDLQYNGPGGVTVWTSAETDVVAMVANAPYGGCAVDSNTVVIEITGADGGKCQIAPQDKKNGSSQLFALFVEGGPKQLQIDCGQAKGAGEMPYLYVDGKAKKILLKGMATVGKVVVDNAGAANGVQIQNISKSKVKGPKVLTVRKAGPPSGQIHSVITSGKLKRLQSNQGGFGGDGSGPGVIAVGENSPKGQIKVSPRGALADILVCKALNQSNEYAYAQAYQECIASNAVLPYVEKAVLKMINAKAIGPAVIAADLGKPFKQNQLGKRVKLTEPVVGKENLVE
jgi:hypothetical protein